MFGPFSVSLSFNCDVFSPASRRLVTFIINGPWAKTVVGVVIHGITVLIGQYLQGNCYLQLQTVNTYTNQQIKQQKSNGFMYAVTYAYIMLYNDKKHCKTKPNQHHHYHC